MPMIVRSSTLALKICNHSIPDPESKNIDAWFGIVIYKRSLDYLKALACE